MKRQLTGPTMALSISMETYHQLLKATSDSGFTLEDWEIGAFAIRDWLVRNDPNAIPLPITSGYQWKHLFLPTGTLLRTVFNGKNHHCLVEQDQLLYEDKPTSPSRFVNAMGGMNRNAWKVTWILFPKSQTWKHACELRQRKRRSEITHRTKTYFTDQACYRACIDTHGTCTNVRQ